MRPSFVSFAFVFGSIFASIVPSLAICEDIAATDYLAERIAYADEPEYNPYTLQLLHEALLSKHFELANDPSLSISDINEPLQALADLYPIGIQVNFAVANFLDYVVGLETGADVDPEQLQALKELADDKRQKANRILQSILDSGDGTSPASAYKVINIIEEYAILDHMELTFDSQSVLEMNGVYYDQILAKSADQTLHELYFDISVFYDDESHE